MEKIKLFDSGIAKKYSQQLPNLIKASLGRGQGGMVGKGLNLWPNVDIDEGEIHSPVVVRFILKSCNSLRPVHPGLQLRLD